MCYRGLAITCLTASYATWWFVMMRPGAADDDEGIRDDSGVNNGVDGGVNSGVDGGCVAV